MQENQGIFSLALQNADIKIDWKNKASYKTPFPKIQKAGFVNGAAHRGSCTGDETW
jgi:hypothetical protein